MEHKAPEKIKIDTLVISDIHLGEDTVRTDALLEVLRKYDCQRLILNGDILNGLHFKRLNTAQWHVLSMFRKLSKRSEVIWVHGNHDAQSAIISHLLGLKVHNKYIWQSAGKKFLAIHGHQYDRFLNNNFLVSQAAFAVYKFLKDVDRSGFLPGLVKQHSTTWQRGSEEVRRGAVKLGQSLGASFVFSGHTHKIEDTAVGNIRYINTGSWNEKPSGYIIVTEDRVELIQTP